MLLACRCRVNRSRQPARGGRRSTGGPLKDCASSRAEGAVGKKKKGDKTEGAGGAPTSSEPPPPPPPPTIHEAALASDGSGAVEYGVEIDEAAAVARRRQGDDVVVRGSQTNANRALARKIEAQVGPPSPPQFPHTRSAGPRALPHFHQHSRAPGGHLFYETDKRKARKKT